MLSNPRAASSRASSVDPYTILEETDDRVMATSLVMQWRLVGTDPGELGFDGLFARIRDIAIAVRDRPLTRPAADAAPHRRGDPGEFPLVAEVRMSAPNKHHFVYDFSAFDDVENNKEVFHADDRPYGLIQAAVSREDAPTPARPGSLTATGYRFVEVRRPGTGVLDRGQIRFPSRIT